VRRGGEGPDRPRRRRAPVLAYGVLALLGGLVALGVWAAVERRSGGEEVHWRSPYAALLVAASALLAWVGLHLRPSRAASLLFSRVGDLRAARPGLAARAVALPAILRVLAVGLLALALARPQTFRTEVRVVEGIDVMLVLDLSRSMEERDLGKNRLDAGQRTIREFLAGRASDRIGLIVFAREALLSCPLTLDYRTLEEIVSDLAVGDVPPDGTAIGDALGLALAQLGRSQARSRAIVLVSDGDSNVVNELEPREALALAQRAGIRVFSVLMGREQGPGAPGASPSVNPALLKELARETGGLYFNAGDDAELSASFERIRSELEKNELKVVGTTADTELFPYLVVPALALLLLELGLAMTRLRRFP
jgi:Ca-activated chloride channel family protein